MTSVMSWVVINFIIKKNSDLLIKYKIANCLKNKRYSNFRNEVCKIKKSKSIIFVNSIDEAKESNFKNQYEQLYNSFPDDNSKIKNVICNNINKYHWRICRS